MTQLSILYIAYPLLTVTPESSGGAEQALLTVEREMVRAGHRTTVGASAGSQIAGRLLATGLPAATLDEYERREREHHVRILKYLREHPSEFDLIHDMSGSFFRHASHCPVPVLATLHLPRSFYPQDLFRGPAPGLFFNCVSHSQAQSFADCPNVVGVVHNGIATERFPLVDHKNGYVLWLGRICEEKAPHRAIAAAGGAGLPLVIAGQVYPFRYHQSYFEREVRPWLGTSRVRYVSCPSFAEKVNLLQQARALLVTSTVAETSSLAAMEAMASGTPVVAFRHGALPEIVADGETGFLVDSVEAMSAWLSEVRHISPQACRAHVQRHFSATRMAREYEALYRRVLAEGIRAAA